MSGQPDPPASLLQYAAPLPVGGDAAGAAAAQSGASAVKSDAALDEVLNSILPPRMWTQEDGSSWMQYVAKEASSRLEVVTIQQHLEQKLMQRQARETGICAVREDLYKQLFDELIRQVTLESPERGLLLLRARDEIRMTLDAYKTLHSSSVTFGVRKALQGEEGMADMEAEIAGLREGNTALENEMVALRSKLEVIERANAEARSLDEKKRREEIAFLKHQQQHLEQFLSALPKA